MSVLKYKHPVLGWIPVPTMTHDANKLDAGPLRWDENTLYRDNVLVSSRWSPTGFSVEDKDSQSASVTPGSLVVKSGNPNYILKTATIKGDAIIVRDFNAKSTFTLIYPELPDETSETLATEEYVRNYFDTTLEEILNGSY